MNEFSQTSLKGQGLLLLEQGIARVCSIGEQVLQSYCFFFQVLSQHSVFRNSGPLVARKSFELVSPSRPLSPQVHYAFSGVPHGELVCPNKYLITFCDRRWMKKKSNQWQIGNKLKIMKFSLLLCGIKHTPFFFFFLFFSYINFIIFSFRCFF